MNQLKELGKEFNISQFKLKLFTTLSEKNMLPAQEDIFKLLDTLELLTLDTLVLDILEPDQMLSIHNTQQSQLLEFIQQQYLLLHIKLIKQQSQLPPHQLINMEVAVSISKTQELVTFIALVKALLLELLELEAIMATHLEDN